MSDNAKTAKSWKSEAGKSSLATNRGGGESQSSSRRALRPREALQYGVLRRSIFLAANSCSRASAPFTQQAISDANSLCSPRGPLPVLLHSSIIPPVGSRLLVA